MVPTNQDYDGRAAYISAAPMYYETMPADLKHRLENAWPAGKGATANCKYSWTNNANVKNLLDLKKTRDDNEDNDEQKIFVSANVAPVGGWSNSNATECPAGSSQNGFWRCGQWTNTYEP